MSDKFCMIKKYVLLIFILFSTNLGAAVDELAEYLKLSLEVDGIIQKAHPYDGKLKLTTNETELFLERGKLEALRQDANNNSISGVPCSEVKTKSADKFNIMMLLRISKTEKNGSQTGFKDNPAGHIVNLSPGTSLYSDAKSLEQQVDDIFQQSMEMHNAVSASGLVPLVSTAEEQELLKSEIRKALVKNFLLNSKTDLERNKIYSSVKDSLSFDEKIGIISSFGGDFVTNYDHERVTDNMNSILGDSAGVIELQEMLNAVLTGDTAGVCGDIAVGQAQMLAGLGVKNTYVLGYMPGDIGHAVVIAQDPDDPSKFVKMNYSVTSTSSNVTGTNALNMDASAPDIGTTYRIFDSNGQAMASIPTALGTILKEQTLGRDSLSIFDEQENIVSVKFKSNGNSFGAFVGKTESGDTVIGIAATTETNGHIETLGIDTKTDAGVALAKVTHNRDGVTINALDFYVGLQSEAAKKVYKSDGGAVEVKAFTNITTGILIGQAQSPTYDGALYDGHLEYSYGLRSTVGKKDSPVKLKSQVSAHGAFNLADVRETGSYGLQHEYILIQNSLDVEVQEQSKMMLESVYMIHNMGEIYDFRVGYSNDSNGKVLVGKRGRMTDSMPLFMPGAERENYVDLSQEWDNKWAVQVQYRDREFTGNKATIQIQKGF